jgi:hypothetical protein
MSSVTRSRTTVLTEIRRLEETQRAVALFRSHPEYTVPDFTAAVTALLSGHRCSLGRS